MGVSFTPKGPQQTTPETPTNPPSKSPPTQKESSTMARIREGKLYSGTSPTDRDPRSAILNPDSSAAAKTHVVTSNHFRTSSQNDDSNFNPDAASSSLEVEDETDVQSNGIPSLFDQIEDLEDQGPLALCQPDEVYELLTHFMETTIQPGQVEEEVFDPDEFVSRKNSPEAKVQTTLREDSTHYDDDGCLVNLDKLLTSEDELFKRIDTLVIQQEDGSCELISPEALRTNPELADRFIGAFKEGKAGFMIDGKLIGRTQNVKAMKQALAGGRYKYHISATPKQIGELKSVLAKMVTDSKKTELSLTAEAQSAGPAEAVEKKPEPDSKKEAPELKEEPSIGDSHQFSTVSPDLGVSKEIQQVCTKLIQNAAVQAANRKLMQLIATYDINRAIQEIKEERRLEESELRNHDILVEFIKKDLLERELLKDETLAKEIANLMVQFSSVNPQYGELMLEWKKRNALAA